MTGLIVCLCCQHFDLQEKSVGLCVGKCQATGYLALHGKKFQHKYFTGHWMCDICQTSYGCNTYQVLFVYAMLSDLDLKIAGI